MSAGEHPPSPWGDPAPVYVGVPSSSRTVAGWSNGVDPGPVAPTRATHGRRRAALARIKAAAGLAVIALAVAGAVALTLSAALWAVAAAVHHAASA